MLTYEQLPVVEFRLDSGVEDSEVDGLLGQAGLKA